MFVHLAICCVGFIPFFVFSVTVIEKRKNQLLFLAKMWIFHTEKGHFDQKTKNGMNPTQHIAKWSFSARPEIK